MTLKMRDVTLFLFAFLYCYNTLAQEDKRMVRLAKLVIDPAWLERYNALLKEEI